MGRRADSTLMSSVAAERANLVALEANLRAFGDLELSQAVKRARKEMDIVYNMAQNTFGVNADAVRK